MAKFQIVTLNVASIEPKEFESWYSSKSNLIPFNLGGNLKKSSLLSNHKNIKHLVLYAVYMLTNKKTLFKIIKH